MRIWSKKLIPVLPTKQLKSMRYELGDMIKQYPDIKHPLVKFANNYDCSYLGEYFILTCKECAKRKIKMSAKYSNDIISLALENSKYDDIYYLKNNVFGEDNKEYLTICYWNLYEKHLRKMITDEEWQKIEDLFKEEI